MKKIINDLQPADSIQINDAGLNRHSIVGYLATPAENNEIMPGGTDSITIGLTKKIAYTIVVHHTGEGSKYYAKQVNSTHIGYSLINSMKDAVQHILNCNAEIFLFNDFKELYDWAKNYD